MAEQKKANEALNVEEALSQSEASYITYFASLLLLKLLMTYQTYYFAIMMLDLFHIAP